MVDVHHDVREGLAVVSNGVRISGRQLSVAESVRNGLEREEASLAIGCL